MMDKAVDLAQQEKARFVAFLVYFCVPGFSWAGSSIGLLLCIDM